MVRDLPEELILRIGDTNVGFAANLTRTNKRYHSYFQPKVDRAKERLLKVIEIWKGMQRFSEQVKIIADIAKPRTSCTSAKDLREIWNSAQNEDKQEILLDIVLSFALGPSICRFAKTEAFHERLRGCYKIIGDIVAESGLLYTPLPEIHYWLFVDDWFEITPNRTFFVSWSLNNLPRRTEYLNELMDPEDEDSVYEAKVFLDELFEEVMNILDRLPKSIVGWVALMVSLEMF